MTILFIALLIICTMFALVAIAVTRKLTPAVNDKRTVHYLKLDYKYCDDVYNCYKRFELRKNDRNYEQGDIIRFIPVDKNMMVEHKIQKCFYQIVDIFRPEDYQDEFGTVIRDGYVILSIAPCYYSFKDDNGKKCKK